MTINVYSVIDLMMLFGVVKKSSILQVDYSYFDGLRAWRRSDLLNPFRKLTGPVAPVTPGRTLPGYFFPGVGCSTFQMFASLCCAP